MVWTIGDDDEDDILDEDPEAVEDYHDEWIGIAEEIQIAEGDITVSETVDGNDPTPDLDDVDRFEEIEMSIADEDELGFNFDDEDPGYVDEDDED
jgi:hypothetical protein